MHSLIFLEPGHFHAALTLRAPNPRVDDEIHLYARTGAERDAFLALVASFNARAAQPTAWRVRVHEHAEPIDALVAERREGLVILAGRNDTKLATIARLHAAGFDVLADKPWLTRAEALPHLETVTAGPPLAMDIMTSRFDITARLLRRIRACEALFGDLRRDGAEPAIELASVHHLYKVVNGRPLRRPPWYYDVDVQGDGLVDIQSHMVDQVQWQLEGEQGDDRDWNADEDVELVAARRWSTEVPLALYRESTGEERFPERLRAELDGGVLALAANGELEYRLRGVHVRQRAEWRQREPEGGGDLHAAVLRGTRAEVTLTQGPETGFRPRLRLAPRDGAGDALESLVAESQGEFPGLAARAAEGGYELTLPAALDSGHESHFPMVLDACLDHLESGRWPRALARRISLRYTLLARGRELALGMRTASLPS
ncbi:MAG: putative oxidoreductase C-terminal domain-containing protein [Gammaproteobacteria bacterium]|nr:putative oxidoreductase C-terminal domain-containing protein [Gammaproteobacteria bacterium]